MQLQERVEDKVAADPVETVGSVQVMQVNQVAVRTEAEVEKEQARVRQILNRFPRHVRVVPTPELQTKWHVRSGSAIEVLNKARQISKPAFKYPNP